MKKDKADEFKVGDSVRLTDDAVGARSKNREGVVVGQGARPNTVRILRDGLKTVEAFPVDCLIKLS